MNITVQNTEIDVYHVSQITAGHGHKKITVILILEGVQREFKATTDNMPGFDDAMDLEGDEKALALYELVAYKLEDQIAEFVAEVYE